MSTEVLKVFLQKLRCQSLSRDRQDRAVCMMLLDPDQPLELRKTSAADFLVDGLGLAPSEAEERVEHILGRLQEIRVGPGPLRFEE